MEAIVLLETLLRQQSEMFQIKSNLIKACLSKIFYGNRIELCSVGDRNINAFWGNATFEVPDEQRVNLTDPAAAEAVTLRFETLVSRDRTSNLFVASFPVLTIPHNMVRCGIFIIL